MTRATLLSLALILAACKQEDTKEPADTDAPPATDSDTDTDESTSDTVDTSAPQTTPDPKLEQLRLGEVDVQPPFDPDTRYYWVRASDLLDGSEIVAVPEPGAAVEISIQTPDGEPLTSGPALTSEPNRRVRIDVTSADGTETQAYSVALLSDEFPDRTIVGTATEGWTFMTCTFKEPNGTTRALMIVDGNGTPGWWRELAQPAYDLRVAPDGRLTWIGRTEEDTTTLQNIVLAADGSEIDVALPASTPEPGWMLTQVDEHEWYLLEDGTAIRILNYRVTEDLSPWGGPVSQRVEHQMAQHVDLDGTVLFEFSTEGMVPYNELPPNFYGQMDELDWEPIHFNSIDVDPADGHWVVSMHRVSMVVKVARTGPQAGQILWQLGGTNSDFTFVDDTRPSGWVGFGGQHSARVTGPDRIEMFDNANGDAAERGDMRIIEYQLDLNTMEATVHSQHVWEGRGRALAAGSVQSLPNGGHIVGFGSVTTDNNGERVPTITELDAAGNELWSLFLPDNSWTYRAWRFQGDPMEWRWEP